MKHIKITPKHYLTFSTNINTQGHNATHQYIPGSTFNGVSATQYYTSGNTDLKEAFAQFHSGLNKFGQGQPIYNGQRCYPVPASWHIKKEVTAKLKSSDAIDPNILLNLATKVLEENEKDTQLVGQRDYYFYVIGEGNEQKFQKLSSTIIDKTGIQIENKKAKDKIFFINEQLHKHQSLCYISTLEGGGIESQTLPEKMQLGQRRNGEQGHVVIEDVQATACIKNITVKKGDYLYLWLQTDMILCDEFGQASTNPKNLTFNGITDLNWIKEQSFYRVDNRCRRNQHYNAYLSDELHIKAGAVLTYKAEEDVTLFEESYIGLYNEMGFGHVLINHPYVTSNEPAPSITQFDDIAETRKEPKKINAEIYLDDDAIKQSKGLIEFLDAKKEQKLDKETALKKLPELEKKLETHYRNQQKPTSTQWSNLYREALSRDKKAVNARINEADGSETIKNVLNEHSILTEAMEDNSKKEITNIEWITLQHYTHAALKIANNQARETETNKPQGDENDD